MAKWNNEFLKDAIFDSMLILNIKRMPSKSELDNISKINVNGVEVTGKSLVSAIRSNGGFIEISNQLKLNLKK